MSFTKLKIPCSGIFLAVLGLVVAPGFTQGANLLTATNTPTGAFALTCNSAGPGSSVSVSVAAGTAPTGSNTITVTYTTPTGMAVTGASGRVISSTNTPLVFVINAAAACAGLTPGSNAVTLQFKALATGGSTANDVAVTGTIVASLLVASPTALTVTCAYDGVSHYVVSPAQTVTVTSPVAGSLATAPLTSALGTNLVTTSLTGGSASSTGVGASPGYTFNVVEATPGSGACPTGPQNLVLTSGTLTKNIVVTFQILTWSPLTPSTTTPTISFVRGSTTPVTLPVTISSTIVPNAFFSVDTTTLPAWLTVDVISGTVTGGKTLHFTTTNSTSSYTPGSYTATVHLKVSGYADYPLSFILIVTDPPPTLSVEGGTTQSLTWSVGTTLPTTSITAVSSGAPIPYTVSTIAGTLSPQVASASGLAYNFGSAIPVTFAPSIFASAVPGQILSGNVILTWGSGKTIVVTLNITVTFTSATATTSSIVPATLPTSAVGQTYIVTLYGTGFVPSSDPTQQTVAGIVNTTGATVGGIPAGQIGQDANVVATVLNASTIVLSITVPAADPNLPFFAGTPKVVTFGVCNPNGSSCSAPSGRQTVTIASGPTFTTSQLVSAATFAAPTSIAPYDILTLFGNNFCTSNGTGCVPGQVLYGTPTGTYPAYPTFLTPDTVGSGSTPRNLTVTFANAATTPTLTVNAPLLFATNNQINFLVPSVITTGNSWPSTVYITVNFGTTAAVQTSGAVGPFTIGTSDAGIFTVNADGSGDGAILDTNWNLISNTNPAAIRASTGSGTVQIFGTGLGAPSAGSITAYLGGLSGGPATMDGLVILNGTAPVMAANPSVYIGSASALSSGLVTYAGWVSGSVAGLYQVNAQLPAIGGSFTDAAGQTHGSGITGPVQLGVKIGASQSNVSMWVLPQLNVTAPTPLSGGTGATWTGGTAMTATGSTPGFVIPTFMLPAGMTIDPAAGTITAAPTATGAYVVSATAVDTSTPPVSGTTNFLVNVTGTNLLTLGITLDAGSLPLIRPSTYGTANGNVTTVIPATGTAPYTYTVAPSGLAAAGITVNSNGLVSTSASTPAGVYEVTVTVTDSLAATNNISFPVTVYPALTSSNGEAYSGHVSTNQTATTISAATGSNSSVITYSTNNTYGVTVGSSTGVVTVPSTITVAGTYYIDITATDATVPSGTGISSSNAAGGVSTIYVAVKLQ